jgi:hypothetical protein
MRLKKEQIQKVSEKILHSLQAKNLVNLKVDAGVVLERIKRAIQDDMDAEDKLDLEVRKIMDRYKQQISSGQLSEQQVFQMIKKQLVKERKLVI